jgi:hypothetical protein
MMTRTMELGKGNLALKYGEAKKQLYQSERTGAQTSIDTDVDMIRLRLGHEGTKILPAGVNRNYLKFAGICIGNEGKVSHGAALVLKSSDRRPLKADKPDDPVSQLAPGDTSEQARHPAMGEDLGGRREITVQSPSQRTQRGAGSRGIRAS